MKNERKIFYPSKDMIKLCGILNEPLNKTHKSVLLLHGITVNKNEYDNFFVDIAKEICNENFSSLRFDFRGHGESGGNQRDMTVIGELLDTKASAEIVLKESRKLSIIATSFGAGPAILYAAQNQDIVKSLILICPVLDYSATFLKPVVAWAKDSFNEQGYKHLDKKGYLLLDGDFEIGAKLIEEFRVIKPYDVLKEIKCPVLTIHSEKDSMVPYSISKKYGVPNRKSKFMTLKGADHGFVDARDETGNSKETKRNREILINTIKEWLNKNG